MTNQYSACIQLTVDDFWVGYGQDEDWIINGLDLNVSGGECIGIVGNNGSGKSTLAHALIGVIPYVTSGRTKGRVNLNGMDVLSQDIKTRLEYMGYSFQDVESQILFGSVADIIGINERTSDKNLLKKAINYLGIEHLLKRMPDELSGGEAQRVALVTALRCGPKLVLYDEATSALDPGTKLAFGSLVQYLKRLSKSIILMGQRSEMLLPYCDRLVTLHKGHLYVSDNSTIRFQILKDNAENFWDLMNRKISKDYPSPPKLNMKGVSFIRKKDTGFSFGPIDISVSPGDTVAILGPNGSGKTTLFLLLSGMLKALSGSYILDEKYYTSTKKAPWPQLVTMVTQSPLNQIIGSSIGEELNAITSPLIFGKDLQMKEILHAHFPYLELEKDPLQLSYGQQRMLIILCTLLSNQSILLIDEPEQGLDNVSLNYIKTWFRMNRESRKKTVLFSTHDLKLAAEIADRCILISNGKLRAEIRTRSPEELENWYFQYTEITKDV